MVVEVLVYIYIAIAALAILAGLLNLVLTGVGTLKDNRAPRCGIRKGWPSKVTCVHPKGHRMPHGDGNMEVWQ